MDTLSMDNTPNGLFFNDTDVVRMNPKRSIFQRHLKTTIIIIIHWQTTQTTQDFFSNYTNLDNPIGAVKGEGWRVVFKFSQLFFKIKNKKIKNSIQI